METTLFARAKEAELRSSLDRKALDLNKKVPDKDRVMGARWVLTWQYNGQAMARLCNPQYRDPDVTQVSRDRSTLSAQAEAPTLRGVE